MSARYKLPRLRGLRAALLRGAAAWLLLLLSGTGGWIALANLQAPPDTDTRTAAAWGSEALRAMHGELSALSPVAPANACGLGASSCFKCHNGKRAPAPALDAQRSPWHVDHQSVNYSCAGCHQGNPRILKQEIAHEKLVSHPLGVPEKTCASCHSATEVEPYLSRYQKVLNGGPQP
jgi:hypothetical protein